MRKLILIVLMLGLWGMVRAEYDPADSLIGDNPYGTQLIKRSECNDTFFFAEEVTEDSLWIKHCRVDTIGWVTKVCETHFRWEYSAPNYGSDCIRQDGMAVSPAADRLVWNRKEKPPTMQWVVRTKKSCWYVLNREIIDKHLDSGGEEE